MKNFPGLVRRGSVYYVRLRVPPDLLAVLKRSELKQSLGTKDIKEARREYQRIYGRLLRTITEAREKLGLDQAKEKPVPNAELERIVRDWFFRTWEGTQKALNVPATTPTTDEMADQAEMELQVLTDPSQQQHGEHLAFAARLLREGGHTAPRKEDVEVLGSYLKRGLALLNGAVVDHYRNRRFHHAIDDPLFQRGDVHGSREGPVAGASVSEVIDKFGADPQRKKLSPKNRLGYLMPFRLLKEIAGADSPLASVSRDHARQIRLLLAQLPANATKRFRDMPLQRVAKSAQEQGLKPMDAATAENTLRNLSAFFSWAIREEYFPARNPFEKLQPLQEKKGADEGRVPYDADALTRIFSSPIYTERKGYEERPGRYWIPLIALYQGARSNEICQMEIADVDEEDGVPIIHIRKASETDQAKRVKTASGERSFPIHPRLLELGFREFVARQRKRGEVHLFPDVPMGSTGYRSDVFGKWFARFQRSVGIVDRRMTFHGFRHNFADAARAADIPSEIVEEMCGWSDGKKSMRRHYGRGYSIARKRQEIAKISYACLEAIPTPADPSKDLMAAGSA